MDMCPTAFDDNVRSEVAAPATDHQRRMKIHRAEQQRKQSKSSWKSWQQWASQCLTLGSADEVCYGIHAEFRPSATASYGSYAEWTVAGFKVKWMCTMKQMWIYHLYIPSKLLKDYISSLSARRCSFANQQHQPREFHSSSTGSVLQ